MGRLTPATFLATAEMVAAHLRIREADRWSEHVCRLKFSSFTSEFPEVSEAQFMWAAEQWIQRLDPKAFARYPTWRELMAPLYRTEAGLANRSYGFRDGLPSFVAPTAEQLAMLPRLARPLLGAPDPANADAYLPFAADQHPLLPPPQEEALGLTEEQWQSYLSSRPQADGADVRPTGAAADPAAGAGGRPVVNRPVQQGRKRSRAADVGVPG